MKKILISLGIVVSVASIVAGGTIAFYNDTETSSGNIFTAGSIDLKVDHLNQTYNGVDCETCSVDVYSSTATNVVAASVGASNQGPFPVSAEDVSSPHPAWQNEAALAPAYWIWATNPTTVADTTNDATYTFENKFQWNGTPVGVNLDLALASDNGYKVILNGTTIVDKLGIENNYNPAVSLTGGEEATFIGAMVNGENTLDIIVWNKPLAADPVNGNPAGLLFNLNIHRDPQECEEDSAFQQACILWQEQDLDGSQTFFNFGDIKPADWGTNLISLHVESNDAFVCLLTNNLEDDENTVIEPEIDANDTLDDGPGFGELSGEIEFFAWDDGGDGVYQNSEDILIPVGTPMNQIDILIEEMTLSSGGIGYIGLAWCAGEQTLNVENVECDGGGMSNVAQTDSVISDLVAYAEQVRNNTNFECSGVNLEQQ